VQIALRYFDGCPNWRLAEARVREALAAIGASEIEITYERVETQEQAERLGFRGSPTLLVDGEDPFADQDAPVGLACRIYGTEEGPRGAPSVAQLRAALGRG
jgi:hypothetical protein